MTRFEDRHRELRDGADFETEHEFNVRTGSLVDDLVAAVRAREDCECGQQEIAVPHPHEDPRHATRIMVKQVGCHHDDAVTDALAALDEASRG